MKWPGETNSVIKKRNQRCLVSFDWTIPSCTEPQWVLLLPWMSLSFGVVTIAPGFITTDLWQNNSVLYYFRISFILLFQSMSCFNSMFSLIFSQSPTKNLSKLFPLPNDLWKFAEIYIWCWAPRQLLVISTNWWQTRFIINLKIEVYYQIKKTTQDITAQTEAISADEQ